MLLCKIHIIQLRNIREAELSFHPKINVFYGANGSGKTSLLEAIHYLSLAKSFRTHLADRVIQFGTEQMSLFGQVEAERQQIPLGIQRFRHGSCLMRLAGETVNSATELNKLLPVQILHPTSHRLLTDGPKLRRQFLDWGVFHVEPQFYSLWQEGQHSLKQRNSAIRKNCKKQEVTLWNSGLVTAAESLDKLRKGYFEQLIPLFNQTVTKLMPSVNNNIKLVYYPGWNPEIGLNTVLENSLERDLLLGYTQFGPHRADIKISVNKTPAKDILSQGQQKLVVYALRLAQGQLFQKCMRNTPIYLIDDLPAELDQKKRTLVINTLHDLNAQLFITGAEKTELKTLFQQANFQMFHVEHGKVTPSC